MTNERLMNELQRGMSAQSKDQSYLQNTNMSNSIRPFSSTHEFDFGSAQQKKMKNTVMSQRSGSNNSSIYDQVLHSPKIKNKPKNRLEYRMGQRYDSQSSSTYEVLADIIEGGQQIQMSSRHEREMVDRLNQPLQRSVSSNNGDQTVYSYKPTINDYSKHMDRRSINVFQSLSNDAQIR